MKNYLKISYRLPVAGAVDELIPFDDESVEDCERASVELVRQRLALRELGIEHRVSVFRANVFDFPEVGVFAEDGSGAGPDNG
jgi:hypothetical protein